MKVYFDKTKKEYIVKAENVNSMLKELEIQKNTVIVSVNGELVDEDYIFKKSDKVKVYSVVSGG